MPEFHRRSVRLPDYDYSQPNAYFVTIVTENRRPLLGEIVDGQVHLSAIGKIVEACWHRLSTAFPIDLDEFVIMPNHLHGIIFIQDLSIRRGEASGEVLVDSQDSSHPDASPFRPSGTTRGSLAAILQNFKSISTCRINAFRDTPSNPLWQRNYYEHIIRSEATLASIRAYILANPVQWEQDPENPITRKFG